MITFIIVMVVIGLAKWLVYTGLLWAMIRVQNLNYNLLGLFASSFVGTALTYVPVVGPYVGWAVLVICLWKCTGADIAPDVLFTVTIASALMFCVNLFAIGWLMGNLHTISPALAMMDDESEEFAFDDHADDDQKSASEGTNRIVAVKGTPWRQTNRAVAATIVSADTPTNTAAVTTRQWKSASSLPTPITLKGVTLNGGQKLAILSVAKQLHTVTVGDSISVPSGRTPTRFTCEEITRSAVILASEGGEQVKVSFQ